MARLIAIDWDQNQIYAVAADVGRGSVRVQRALTWQEDQPPSAANAEAVGQRLREKLKEAGVAPAPLVGCVSRDRLIVKDIRFPAVPDVEEPAVVRFQTVKELTDSPEDVVIDYVARSGSGQTERQASALVIQKKLLETYQKIAASAGLKLSGLSPRLMGAATCLRRVMGTTVVTPAPEPATGVIAVVMVGEKQAEFAVLKGDHFLLARSVAAGPNLLRELRTNLAVHAGQMPDQPVVAVYVGGKGAGELRERMTELVDIPVHTFDPFAGGEVGQLPPGNRGLFAGPMGLLYHKAGTGLPVNWVSPRQPKPPADPSFGKMRFYLVCGVAVLIGLFIMGQLMIAAENDAITKADEAKLQKGKDLELASDQGKRLKAMNDWDNPAWLDEMYEIAGRAQLNDVRIEEFNAESLQRDAKNSFVGKITMKGKLLPATPGGRTAAYNTLRSEFTRDPNYSIGEGSKLEDTAFTLVVQMKRRPPDQYKTKVDDPTVVKDKSKSASKEAVKGKDSSKTKG